ncbi:MAG TPA: hypothetical protein VMB53_12460 [Gaiellaceae bacterium]|nr:hypothetical protein [Gaiellaceae bacterium]
MRPKTIAAAVATAAVLGGAGAALADTMHPELGAKLSGMGEHGIVNLQSKQSKGQICWTFELTTKGITGASIRDKAGMKVAELGMHYTPKGCGAVASATLAMIEKTPGHYVVWVDTKSHPGDLRGTLFAGMAHM